MKRLLLSLFFLPVTVMANGYLENPQPDSTQSGIGVISGWHCSASTISVFLNGLELGSAGSGTTRGDLSSVCGHTYAGFSLLFNFNDLEPGEHVIKVLADGALLEERRFNSVRSGGVTYLRNVSKETTVSDFPTPGSTAALSWSESKQSFVVTRILKPTDPSVPVVNPSTLSDLQGSYVATVLPGSNHAAYEKAAGSKITISVSPTSVVVDGRVFTWDGVDDFVQPDVIKYLDGRPDAAGYSLKVTGSRNSRIIVTFASSDMQPIFAQLYEPLYSTRLGGGYVYFDFGE